MRLIEELLVAKQLIHLFPTIPQDLDNIYAENKTARDLVDKVKTSKQICYVFVILKSVVFNLLCLSIHPSLGHTPIQECASLKQPAAVAGSPCLLGPERQLVWSMYKFLGG